MSSKQKTKDEVQQNQRRSTHEDKAEPLPPDLEALVEAAEQDRVIYEDPWTST